MSGHHVGEQTNHQRERLGNYPEDFHDGHQGNGQFEKHGNFRPKDFFPIGLGTEHVDDNHREQSQHKGNRNITRYVGTTRE